MRHANARGSLPRCGTGGRGILLSALLLVFLVPALCSAQTEYAVSPPATDPNIDLYTDNHFAEINAGLPQQDLLLVNFPGTSGRPFGSRKILREAANHGIRAIGLMYPNDLIVFQLCGLDKPCYEQVRLEVLDGIDRTSVVDISPANAIVNRLVKLLEYLDEQHPADGWGTFLDGNQPRWAAIVFSGHSQGGLYAALSAREHLVSGVGLIANGCDLINNQPAPWLSAPHQTPSARYYGFLHDQDTIAQPQLCWDVLGVPGTLVDVDTTPPPYGGSHRLFTDRLPQYGGYENAHYSVVVDFFTPLRTNGTPYYDEVWLTLMSGGEALQTPTLSAGGALLLAVLLMLLSLRLLRRSRAALPAGPLPATVPPWNSDRSPRTSTPVSSRAAASGGATRGW